MINKIKDLMNVKELIDDINNKVNSHSETVGSLSGEIAELKAQLSEIKNNQKEFLTNFRENVDVIKKVREDFEKEMYRFKGLKEKTQKSIMDKFEEELQKELKLQMDSLKKDYGSYEEVKKGLGEVTMRLGSLNEEMVKFTNISSSIKEKDFEMEKFAKQLLEMDQEKLNLIKKIDTLERLISRMRRGN